MTIKGNVSVTLDVTVIEEMDRQRKQLSRSQYLNDMLITAFGMTNQKEGSNA